MDSVMKISFSTYAIGSSPKILKVNENKIKNIEVSHNH